MPCGLKKVARFYGALCRIEEMCGTTANPFPSHSKTVADPTLSAGWQVSDEQIQPT